MKADKLIDILNSLVEVHNDRIEGYQIALNETEKAFLDEGDLQTLFSGFIQTSENCKDALINEIEKLGGSPVNGTNTLSKIYRSWMDIKFAFTCNDRYTILKSCEHGEGIALEVYNNVLTNNASELKVYQQKLLGTHYKILRAEKDKVLELFNHSLEHE
ncbi:MAG: PA2169 family four-helix-bundle protein [Bacteroidetes bacterium]|nr:PA2169 family four-helix-bundle protein [Bacteroidota bacterium]